MTTHSNFQFPASCYWFNFNTVVFSHDTASPPSYLFIYLSCRGLEGNWNGQSIQLQTMQIKLRRRTQLAWAQTEEAWCWWAQMNNRLIKLTHVFKIKVCKCPPLATVTTREASGNYSQYFWILPNQGGVIDFPTPEGPLCPAIKWKLIYPRGPGPSPSESIFFGQQQLGRPVLCLWQWYIAVVYLGEIEMCCWWIRWQCADRGIW